MESRASQCMICMSSIGIPCYINKHESCLCNCEYVMCLDCLIQYYQNASCFKCIICKYVYQYARDFSDVVVDYGYARELDTTNPIDIGCPSCDTIHNTRMDAIKHMQTCKEVASQCRNLVLSDTVRCNKCNTYINNEDFRSHITHNCDYALTRCILCNVKMPKNTIFDHTDTCIHALVECKHCFAEVKRVDLESHMNECEYVTCECRGCLKQVLRINLLTHHQEECPHTIITCEHCLFGYKRSLLPEHYKECPKIKITCHLCNTTIENQYMSEHTEKCKYNITLLDTRVKPVLDILKQDIADMQSRMKSVYFKLGIRW